MMHLMNRAFNRPVLLEPAAGGFFYAYLSSRLGAQELTLPDGVKLVDGQIGAMADSFSSDKAPKSFSIKDGVAIIPVEGTLAHRFGYLNPVSGMTGYDGITEKVLEASKDSDVKGIFFDIDSPGGEVSGCFDLARLIAKVDKPTFAFADEMACSAAYALASACDEVATNQTGCVGSVGVVMAHTDMSKAAEDQGIKVTFIHAGKHKVDGNQYTALPEDVKNRMQAEIDEVGSQFFELVAENRRMSVEQVEGLGALTFNGEKAVEAGLADAVMTKADAFSTFNNLVQKDNLTMETDMSKNQESAITAEQLSTDIANATASAAADATKAESDRIFAIIDSAPAQNRTAAAVELARSGMGAESALKTLAALPESKPVAADATGLLNAEGGAGVTDLSNEDTEVTAGASLMSYITATQGGR